MKKWGILFILIGCLGAATIIETPFFHDKIHIQIHKKGILDEGEFRYIEIREDQIYQGNLLLVNHDHPVQPESVKKDVVNLNTSHDLIHGFGLIYDETYLSEAISHKFSDMMASAKKDGVQNFYITSGFRDFEKQEELYQEMGSAYALPPGYSEHNLGLSLDVGTTELEMAQAPEGKWIENHAWEHGFILRYPKDKIDVTGIQYEPWHIRYVGLPHSAIMKEKNLALEEYLDYLKENNQLSASIEGTDYRIQYYPLSQNREIPVPVDSDYEISGNNIDGVIVTIFE